MLKRRLIPKLLLASQGESSSLVTTREFNGRVSVGNPVSQAKIFEAQGADELILIDLDARRLGAKTNISVVNQLAEEIFMPFAVGGGVATLDDFKRLLDAGADKVIINTSAIENPALIEGAAGKHGAQCVLVGIDVILRGENSWSLATRSASEAVEGLDPVEWAKRAESLGAGEIMVSSVLNDGTGRGLDLEIGRLIADAVRVPVILSGGCGIARHFVDGFKLTAATGVAAGTYFSQRDQNMTQLRSQVLNAGLLVRKTV